MITADTARLQAAHLNERINRIAPIVQASIANFAIALVSDPKSCPDTLLIVADAMREGAVQLTHIGRDDQADAMRAIADALVDIAPSRAEPPPRNQIEAAEGNWS